MPSYDFSCGGCGSTFEQRASMATEVIACLKCGKSAQRKFSPTLNIFLPEHFRHARSLALPPKGSPLWENMVAPGSVKPEKQETLRDFCKKRGVRGA